MRIVSIIGSNKGKESNEFRLVQEFIKKMDSITGKGTIDHSIYHLAMMNIEPVSGKNDIFLKKIDMDSVDDIVKIYNDLMQADIIILSSPVYFHNVSALFKNLIEHLSPLTHVFGLSGKWGISITSSSNNGNELVKDYINKFFSYAGVNIIGGIDFQEVKNTVEDLKIQESITNLAKLAVSVVTSKKILITENQEHMFQYFKQTYKNQKYLDYVDLSYEFYVWNKTGLGDSNSLSQFTEKILNQC